MSTSEESDLDITPQRDVSFYSNSTTMDYWLFHQSIAITYFGIGVPVIACFGLLVNVFTFFAYQHPDFRSLSTQFLNANLVTDSVLLVSCASIVAPKYWLYQFYQNLDYSHFWRALRAAQTTHVVAYPVFLITKCLSQWYTMALIIEQWIVFARPGRLTKMNTREQGHKMVVLIMSLTVLAHFIVFFKYTRQKVYVWQNGTVPVRTEAMEICLSYTYRSSSYQTYERYIYFLVFEFIPCLITFLFAVLCFTENQRLNSEMMKKDTDITNIKLLRTFRSGRSVSTVLSIAVVFFCLQFINHITHILSLGEFDLNPLHAHCHLTPVARLFRKSQSTYEIIYIYTNIINAAIKPWICITFNDDFRHLLTSCCSWRDKIFTSKASKMAARAFDTRHASFPSPDSTAGSYEVHDDTRSTTSTNYFDAISYSTVGTPMLIHTDFPRSSWEYDDSFEHGYLHYPAEIELTPMADSQHYAITDNAEINKF